MAGSISTVGPGAANGVHAETDDHCCAQSLVGRQRKGECIDAGLAGACCANLLDTDCFGRMIKSYAGKSWIAAKCAADPFCAIGGSKDLRKGFDLLLTALHQLSAEGHCAEAHCIIYGQSQPRNEPLVGYPIHWMGHLHDDWSLALLYNAADVVVVPSRQENLPQTALRRRHVARRSWHSMPQVCRMWWIMA